MALTIFSTVRAPHEPALTIGSLATTTTGIPSIVPRPVTTPSAGSAPPLSAAWLLASRPSSTNDCGVEEEVDALACRQLVLPADLGERPLVGLQRPLDRRVDLFAH